MVAWLLPVILARSSPAEEVGYGRPVLSRRTLLVGAPTAVLLAGCTSDPTVVWLPWNGPSPLPVADAVTAAQRCAHLSARLTGIADRAESWELSERTVAGVTWAASTMTTYANVLSSADPARRRSATPTPVAPVYATSAKAAWAELDAELSAAVSDFRQRALATVGVPSLLWASLAASSAGLRPVIASGRFRPGDDEATTAPLLPERDWRATMIERCHEVVYGLELCLAATGIDKADRRGLRTELSSWSLVRDRLIDAHRGAGAVVPQVPPGYSLAVPKGRASVMALAQRLDAEMLPQLGAWLAATSDPAERTLAAEQLIRTAQSSIRFGGAALRWPGWP